MNLTRLFLSALAALALPAGLLAQPVVSNVAFDQQPDGAGNTEIEVTYGLSSQDGPSTTTCFTPWTRPPLPRPSASREMSAPARPQAP